LLEEDYLNIYNRYCERWDWKRECFIIRCGYCGNIWISSDIDWCPVCESGNIVPVPFRDNRFFNLSWLKSHGFPYIERVLRIV